MITEVTGDSRQEIPSQYELPMLELISPKKGTLPHIFWENTPRQQAWSCCWAVICCPSMRLLSNSTFLVDFFSLCKGNIRLEGRCVCINGCCVFPQSASGDLMIRNIQLKHSGKYVCMVKTDVDSVASAADLIVRGTAQPSPRGTFSTLFYILGYRNNWSLRLQNQSVGLNSVMYGCELSDVVLTCG